MELKKKLSPLLEKNIESRIRYLYVYQVLYFNIWKKMYTRTNTRMSQLWRTIFRNRAQPLYLFTLIQIMSMGNIFYKMVFIKNTFLKKIENIEISY